MALLGVAEDPVLETLAVLLLAIGFLAPTPANVLCIDVLSVGALNSARRASHIFGCDIFVSLLELVLGSTEVLVNLFLHLWEESQRITGLDALPLPHNIRFVSFVVATIFAIAVLVTVPALGEALAVHLQAL